MIAATSERNLHCWLRRSALRRPALKPVTRRAFDLRKLEDCLTAACAREEGLSGRCDVLVNSCRCDQGR